VCVRARVSVEECYGQERKGKDPPLPAA